MNTRSKRLDFRALNDGSDDETASEERVVSSTISAPLLSSHSPPAPTTAIDKEQIRCTYIDDKPGTQCGWSTMDSLRQNSTSNRKTHLAKHSIYPPETEGRNTGEKQQTSVNLIR
ncbi:hypothetical protein V1504DRAFT_494568 [Lipomyces starkeyi]